MRCIFMFKAGLCHWWCGWSGCQYDTHQGRRRVSHTRKDCCILCRAPYYYWRWIV